MNTEKKTKLSVVIPCYLSGTYIESTVNLVCDSIAKFSGSFELILVNDGSTDNTKTVLNKLANDRVKVVNLDKNHGQLIATQIGYSLSSGEYVVTLDDDLQFAPNSIELLLNSIRDSNYLVLSGKYRRAKNGFSFDWKSVISAIIYLFFPLYRNSAYFSSFKIFRKNSLNQYATNIFFFWDIPPKKIGVLEVDKKPRLKGKSNYSIKAYMKTFKHVFMKMLSKFILVLLPVFVILDASLWLIIVLIALFIFSIIYLRHLRAKYSEVYAQIEEQKNA